MEDLELIKQKLDLISKELDVVNKSTGLEFERVAKAFGQIGNLTDLLYLEVSVLVEMLVKKGVINNEEFSKALEETAKKIEEQMTAALKAEETPKEEPKVEKL